MYYLIMLFKQFLKYDERERERSLKELLLLLCQKRREKQREREREREKEIHVHVGGENALIKITIHKVCIVDTFILYYNYNK